MKVKNLNDRGGRPIPSGYDSWLDWWKAQKGLKASASVDCANWDCDKTATLGGHVKKDVPSDGHWYMVPLCSGCNQLTGSFDVNAADMVRITED